MEEEIEGGGEGGLDGRSGKRKEKESGGDRR